MSVCMSVYLSININIYPFIHPSIHSSLHQSFILLFIHSSVNMFSYLPQSPITEAKLFACLHKLPETRS